MSNPSQQATVGAPRKPPLVRRAAVSARQPALRPRAALSASARPSFRSRPWLLASNLPPVSLGSGGHPAVSRPARPPIRRSAIASAASGVGSRRRRSCPRPRAGSRRWRRPWGWPRWQRRWTWGWPRGCPRAPQPRKRLFNLLSLEATDIWIVVIYAITIGLFSLATPIAIAVADQPGVVRCAPAAGRHPDLDAADWSAGGLGVLHPPCRPASSRSLQARLFVRLGTDLVARLTHRSYHALDENDGREIITRPLTSPPCRRRRRACCSTVWAWCCRS